MKAREREREKTKGREERDCCLSVFRVIKMSEGKLCSYCLYIYLHLVLYNCYVVNLNIF